jgi:hypothetical protein
MKKNILLIFVLAGIVSFTQAQTIQSVTFGRTIQNDEILSEAISMFPNPVGSELKIRINNNIEDYLFIHLYKMSGEMFQTMQIRKDKSDFEYIFSLGDLPKGTYICLFRLGNYKAIKKLQKS